MSKRLISLGLILVVGIMTCSMLFAASNIYVGGYYEDINSPRERSLDVKWVFSTKDTYEVGFSGSSVDINTTEPTPVDLKSNAYFLQTEPSSTEAVGKGNVFVYWKISSYEPLTVSLKAAGPLALPNASEDTQKLNWEASWTTKDFSKPGVVIPVSSGSTATDVIGSSEYDYKTVYTQEKIEEEQWADYPKIKIDSVNIDMVTADALSKDAGSKVEGEYTSALVLKVATK